jgi:Tfp pilus assembly protein PilP
MMVSSFGRRRRAGNVGAPARRAAVTSFVLACLIAAGPVAAQVPQKPATPQPAPAVPPAAQKAPPVQPAPPAQPPVAKPAAPAPAGPGAPPAEAYSYNTEGRRDPFVSLLQRGFDLRGPANRPEGLAGLLIGEIMIKGIVKTPRGFVAMLQAPDSKTFIVHANERLFDGTIKAITDDAVVFSQEVNDPLSLVKQREVRKPLRAMQEGK